MLQHRRLNDAKGNVMTQLLLKCVNIKLAVDKLTDSQSDYVMLTGIHFVLFLPLPKYGDLSAKKEAKSCMKVTSLCFRKSNSHTHNSPDSISALVESSYHGD